MNNDFGYRINAKPTRWRGCPRNGWRRRIALVGHDVRIRQERAEECGRCPSQPASARPAAASDDAAAAASTAAAHEPRVDELELDEYQLVVHDTFDARRPSVESSRSGSFRTVAGASPRYSEAEYLIPGDIYLPNFNFSLMFKRQRFV